MGKRKTLISGNWKMHKDHREALHLVRDLGFRLKPEMVSEVEVAIHPPFTSLRSVQSLIEADRLPITLGAQHCYFEESGAYTGEVSAGMLASLDVRHVLCGHSERRHVFGQRDDEVARTAVAVIANGMVPSICVGETQEEREAGDTEAVVGRQLTAVLSTVGKALSGMVIAYEPVWAIGTGLAASPEDAEAAAAFIRTQVATAWGQEATEDLRIQYGGSVKPENAAEYLACPNVDGLLVGGASLEGGSFSEIVSAAVG